MERARLTIVIPTKGRDSLETTLRSFSSKADELLICLNGHAASGVREVGEMISRSGVERWFRDVGVLEWGQGSQSAASNMGISRCRNSAALIIDDDLILEEGVLAEFQQAHDLHPDSLVKGKVVYPPVDVWTDSLRRVWGGCLPERLEEGFLNSISYRLQAYLTVSARAVNTTEAPFGYTPNLLVPRSVYEKMIGIDGYFFGTYLEGAEDHEFHLRSSHAGVPLVVVDRAGVLHEPMTLRSDLRSAARYGRGKAQRLYQDPATKSGLLPEEPDVGWADFLEIPLGQIRRWDLLGGAYQLVWQMVQYRAFAKERGMILSGEKRSVGGI